MSRSSRPAASSSASPARAFRSNHTGIGSPPAIVYGTDGALGNTVRSPAARSDATNAGSTLSSQAWNPGPESPVPWRKITAPVGADIRIGPSGGTCCGPHLGLGWWALGQGAGAMEDMLDTILVVCRHNQQEGGKGSALNVARAVNVYFLFV